MHFTIFRVISEVVIMSDDKPSEEGFKVPSLPFASKPEISPKAEEVAKYEKPEKPVVNTLSKSPAEILKERSEPPLQYTEPSWAGKVPEDKNFYLEELKNGTIVKTHKLKDKSYFSVGRLPSNDIEMEHPSLSRYHAVLQFKLEGSADQPVGFYIYDLGKQIRKVFLPNISLTAAL